MSIKYEIQPIKNSQGTGKDRHYARIFDRAPMSAKQLMSHIQSTCSLTQGDVEATLSALRDVIVSELAQGNRFYIPSIGYLSLSVDLDMPDNMPVSKARADYPVAEEIWGQIPFYEKRISLYHKYLLNYEFYVTKIS